MKKHLLLSCMILIPIVASAEVEIGGIYYALDASGETPTAVVWENPNKYSNDVVIPESVTYEEVSYSVTRITSQAFKDCSDLTSVSIPNSVTTIGNYAFYGCSSLTSVIIPNSVTAIENYTFFGCSSLTTITIPNSVTSIEAEAFSGCDGLTSITLPNNLTSIGDGTFNGCSGLTSITLPNSVKTIGNYAFSGCTGLTSVHITDLEKWCKITFEYGSNPLYYAQHLFLNDKEIKVLEIPDGITSINDYAFEGCKSITTITIPNSVNSIGEYAFDGCSSITSVTIGNNVTSIGDYAFNGCSGLTAVTFPNSVTSIGGAAFRNCSSITSVIIGNSVTSIEAEAFSGCSGLTSITLPDNLISIGDYAFYACSSLTAVTIPNSVTSIGDVAFLGCSSLTSVTIGNSVTSIGDYAFRECSLTSVYITDLKKWCKITFADHDSNPLNHAHHLFLNKKEIKDLTIPDGITSINDFAFCGGENFATVTIPNSVTSIGEEAFMECSGLTSVHITDLEKWCKITFNGSNPLLYAQHLFLNDEEIKVLEIPDGITSVNDYAFEGGIFSDVTIPNSVTSIGEYAFSHCSSLTTITIPNSVTSISAGAFSGCDGLTSITIPNSVTSIEAEAFSGCSGLTSITLPDNLISIGDYAFYACSSLTAVTFPNSVTSIGFAAFWNCSSLKYVKSLAKTPPVLYDNSFSDSEIPLYVPKASVNSYKAKDGWKNFKKIISIDAKFTLTYMVDGEVYKTYELLGGEVINLEEEPSKEGYTFSGWSEIPEMMPPEDIVITGTFTVNKYKLTYKVDGEEYKTSEVEYGAAITAEDEPTKEGYTFSGWSEIPETMPAEDVTITGTFTVNKYKLTYKVDGEEYKTSEVEYGATITAEDEPTKEGYTFSGWSEIPETMPAKDVTITGTFTVNKYKLTYKVDGEEYKTLEVEYGATITAEDEPTKEGYTFSGWSEIPETMPAKDVTITGSFTVNKYKLTYMVDGEEYKTSEVEYGTAIIAEDEPTKEGYTFSGWSEIPETMPAKDVVITGTFTINSYTITYKIDDEVFKTESVEYGSTITPPDAPEKEGYTFEWIDVPETMPAKDITIVGSYTSGIGSVYVEDGDVKWYTLEGKRIETPRKGLNIMKKSNGKNKKVFVK